MPIFQYKALNQEGQTKTGRVDVADRSTALKQIKEMGLVPIEISALIDNAPAEPAAPSSRRKRKVPVRDLVMFTHQMNSMLKANIPLTQALNILGQQAECENLREILKEVRESVEGGSSFADALREHPKAFPAIYVNTVRMGEVGGVLEKVMSQLADFLEANYALNAEVKSALYYPAGIVCMAVLSVTFILVVVMPRMTSVFLESGVELPLPTRILITAGDIVSKRGYLILLGVGLAAVGLRFWLRNEEGRYQYFKILRSLPALGVFLKKVVVTRIAQTMSSLLQSGVPALDSLRLVTETLNDAVVKRSLREACEKVQKGQGIAKPLAQSAVFPPLFVQMVRVGEETGQLEEMFDQVASAYSLEVRYAIKNFISLMEPVIIGIMAMVVMFIVLALAMPMMKIAQVAG